MGATHKQLCKVVATMMNKEFPKTLAVIYFPAKCLFKKSHSFGERSNRV